MISNLIVILINYFNLQNWLLLNNFLLYGLVK